MLTKIALALALVTASAFTAYAQSPRATRAHAAVMSTAVYFDGKKVGQDPDPNVRREIQQYARTEGTY